jgi:hypothetical protein
MSHKLEVNQILHNRSIYNYLKSTVTGASTNKTNEQTLHQTYHQ